MTALNSEFALVDVKKGRRKLAKRVLAGERIPVIFRGFIVSQWSQDDGTSIEFEIEVNSATVAP